MIVESASGIGRRDSSHSVARCGFWLALGCALLLASARVEAQIPVFTQLWGVPAGAYPDLPMGTSDSLITNIIPVVSSGGPEAVTNFLDTGLVLGDLQIEWNFYSFPDRLLVTYDTSLLFDSGMVEGSGATNLTFGPGASTVVSIAVNPDGNPELSTAWDYTLTCTTTNHVFTLRNQGLAINPLTTNVVYAGSADGTNGGGTHISVLDSANQGAFLARLSESGISGGTLSLAAVRVSDDGSIYACSLSGGAGSRFRVYRWAGETNLLDPPSVVFDTGAGTSFPYRIGDWMDVRGSGSSTEIVVSGAAIAGANVSTNFLILRPVDPTLSAFNSTAITFPFGMPCGSRGVAFEGGNHALYAKLADSPTVILLAYDPVAFTSEVTASFDLNEGKISGLDYEEIDGARLLSAISTGTDSTTNSVQHKVKVFRLTSDTSYVVVLDEHLPQPFFPNPGDLGMTDLKSGYLVAGEFGNGLSLYHVGVFSKPPRFSLQPEPLTVVEGGSGVFSALAAGVPPLLYQWRKDSVPIGDATNDTYAVARAAPADAGCYDVVATDALGSTWSRSVLFTVLPPGSILLSPKLRTVDGLFQIDLVCEPGKTIAIEYSTDLTDWIPLVTIPVTTGKIQFVDYDSASDPSRFYRALEAP
jgi:hypothetical protein